MPTPELTGVVARISRIPEKYRDFTESTERALRFYRITAPLLDELLAIGLPHRSGASGRLFDRNDLKTVSLRLRLRSPRRVALASMARALVAGGAAPRLDRTVTVQAHCPRPGHPGACTFAFAPALGPDVELRPTGRMRYEVDVQLPGGERHLRFSAAEQRLVAEVSEFEFHHLPSALNLDLGFLAESGLADCTLATHFLVTRGRRLGVEIRGATGLFLCQPFANRHFWVELRRGGRWVPADPFFITALVRWGVLDAGSWPVTRSPAGTYWRLEIGPGEPLIRHGNDGAGPEEDDEPSRLGPAYFAVQ
jgi:hypothetical protein